MDDIDDKTLSEVAQYLEGTCQSTQDAIDRFALDVEDGILEQRLLDVSIEICVNCDWWHEVSDLEYIESENGGVCTQCREQLGIED
jgi:hypothetical protein